MANRGYEAALHAMQAGIMMEQQLDREERGESWCTDTHKHARVGINSAMLECGAIVSLLVEKGIITREEFEIRLCDAVNEEVDQYERRLSLHFGKKITLV